LRGVGKYPVEADRRENESKRGEADGEESQGAFFRGAVIYLILHRTQIVDDQRGIELSHRLSNGGFDGFRRSRCTQIDHEPRRVFLLQVGLVDRRTELSAEVCMLGIADYTNDGDVKFDVAAPALSNLAADGILQGAEEPFDEREIHDGNFAL